jgi:hypothetical protein
MSRAPYTVTLLDADACTLRSDEMNTVSEARRLAREYISDPEYIDAHKVEVVDAAGECVFDLFANQVSA